MSVKTKILTFYAISVTVLFFISLFAVLYAFDVVVKKATIAKTAETAEFIAKKAAVSTQESVKEYIIKAMQKNDNINRVEILSGYPKSEKIGYDRGGQFEANDNFLIQREIIVADDMKKNGFVKLYCAKKRFEEQKYIAVSSVVLVFSVLSICGLWLNSLLSSHLKGVGSMALKLSLSQEEKRAADNEKRALELELLRQKELFELVFNASLSALFIIQEDKTLANTAFYRLSGYKDGELGKDDIKILFDEKNDFIINFLEKKEGALLVDETGLIRKNKESGFVRVNAVFARVCDKEAYVFSFVDLSALKQKDQMLLVQSRFVAMGEMIANIAHQWRQPLNVIQSSITKIEIYKQMDALTDKFLEDTISNVKRQVFYLSSTIDDFRNFYKDDQSDSFLVLDALKKAFSLVEAAYQNSFIEIKIDESDCGDAKIQGSANRLIQALINILNNAKDAIASQKTKVYGVVSANCEKKGIDIIISVKDSGGGIEPSNLNKIFEPYFSTKNKTQGAGIGLYMTKQIIETSFEGSIEVSNKEFEIDGVLQKGACFKICLPLLTPAPL